jgi:hypothetical protein
MSSHRTASWLALCAGAGLVLGIAGLVKVPSQAKQSEVLALLSKLESECDPDAPSNNYAWSSRAPPTERHRRIILERLHELRDAAAPEVARKLEERRTDEFGEMLIVLAGALGNQAMVIPAAKLMAYSPYPAVRLSAARELCKLRDPGTVEWFEYAAAHDDRFVRNDGCGRVAELYYPVRTVAELALQDFVRERQDWQSSSARN